MRPDPESATATTPRPPTVKQLEARAAKAQKDRYAAWERLTKARAAESAALGSFDKALGHETASFQALCAARQGRAPDPGPPAPETLTSADEED